MEPFKSGSNEGPLAQRGWSLEMETEVSSEAEESFPIRAKINRSEPELWSTSSPRRPWASGEGGEAGSPA